jgi:hypothetical protein
MPRLIARPKWPIVVALVFSAVSYVLWTQTPDVVGTDYWRYVFPGMLIAAGMQVVLLATK